MFTRSLKELSPQIEASAVCVGNFDGVHLGHQEMLGQLCLLSKQKGLASVVVSFDPHPATVLWGKSVPKLLSLNQKSKLLHQYGAHHCVVLPFTQEVSELEANEFLELLLKSLKMKCLLMGENSKLGKDGKGNAETIAKLAKVLNFELQIPSLVHHENIPVSSTLLRKCIFKGDVGRAARVLGFNYRSEGRVIKGRGVGSRIGIPTANLEPLETILPARGVYVTRFICQGKSFPALTNVGFRPTFEGQEWLSVETHILDFSSDLYGEWVEIEWLERLRDEKKFSDPSELIKQIQQDIQQAKNGI